MFGAFPMIYQENRGWNEGIGGLSFNGVGIGMLGAVLYLVFCEKDRYIRLMKMHGGQQPPEARLRSAVVGSISLPIGLFWFAWYVPQPR